MKYRIKTNEGYAELNGEVSVFDHYSDAVEKMLHYKIAGIVEQYEGFLIKISVPINKWMQTKNEFIEWVKVVISEKNIVADHIRNTCGQELYVNDILPHKDVCFKTYNYQHPDPYIVAKVGYDRRPTLASKTIPTHQLQSNHHWDISLVELHREIEFLKTWSTVQCWEDAWVASQKL